MGAMSHSLRTLGAMRRLTSAPALLLLLLFPIGLALGSRQLLHAVAHTSLGFQQAPADGHDLASLAELIIDQPGLRVLLAALPIFFSLLAFLYWTFMSGGVIRRLEERIALGEFMATCGRHFFPFVVQSLYILFLRLIAFGIVMLGSFVSDTILPVALPLVIIISTIARDRSQIAIVLGSGSPYHIRTTLAALRSVFRKPFNTLVASLLLVAQWAVVALASLATLTELQSGGALWALRGAILAACALGLLRLAVLVTRR